MVLPSIRQSRWSRPNKAATGGRAQTKPRPVVAPKQSRDRWSRQVGKHHILAITGYLGKTQRQEGYTQNPNVGHVSNVPQPRLGRHVGNVPHIPTSPRPPVHRRPKNRPRRSRPFLRHSRLVHIRLGVSSGPGRSLLTEIAKVLAMKTAWILLATLALVLSTGGRATWAQDRPPSDLPPTPIERLDHGTKRFFSGIGNGTKKFLAETDAGTKRFFSDVGTGTKKFFTDIDLGTKRFFAGARDALGFDRPEPKVAPNDSYIPCQEKQDAVAGLRFLVSARRARASQDVRRVVGVEALGPVTCTPRRFLENGPSPSTTHRSFPHVIQFTCRGATNRHGS